MSLPKMETGHTCPQCAGGPLVSLSTFMDRGSEPTACALGAQRDFRVGRTVGSQSGSQSSAYFDEIRNLDEAPMACLKRLSISEARQPTSI
jgi:hypothetical protein